MADERDITNPLLKAASKMGARLFRQNVGQAWVGRVTSKVGRSITIADARPFRAGLCVGSSDVIGWTPVTVTPEMVGRKVAVFTAIEVKAGRTVTTKEQAAFVEAVRADGGFAAIVRSVEDGVNELRFDNGADGLRV